MRIMDAAIRDRVSVRGIAYDVVPALHGELRGDDGRTAAVSFLEDFEDVVTGGGIERLQSPIVEDEQIGAPERAQDARTAPVASRQGRASRPTRRCAMTRRCRLCRDREC